MTDDRLIVALDLSTRTDAEALVDRLGDEVCFYKIGYQLAYGGDGIAFGRELIAQGKKVFYDLKLLDIDNTVASGVEAIAKTGAAMLTLHAYPHAMRAAVAAAEGSDLTLLGVTVLTSLDDSDIREAGYGGDVAGLVARRVEQAREIGMGGLVCSPLEAEMVRAIAGSRMAVVTPGIRPKGAALGDQKRVMGPAEALAAGASHLVVGRPITGAPDPVDAARMIVAEMQGGGTRLA